MILTKNFYIDTTKKLDFVTIFHEVRRTIQEAGSEAGLVTVIVPNPGAGLVILDPTEKIEELKKRLEAFMANGLASCLLPKSLNVTFENSKMVIDPWQSLFLIDYETSGRRREFRVQVMTESAAANKDANPQQPGY